MVIKLTKALQGIEPGAKVVIGKHSIRHTHVMTVCPANDGVRHQLCTLRKTQEDGMDQQQNSLMGMALQGIKPGATEVIGK